MTKWAVQIHPIFGYLSPNNMGLVQNVDNALHYETYEAALERAIASGVPSAKPVIVQTVQQGDRS